MEIKLPDYKEIASKIKRNEVSVKEEEIENALKWLQKSRAKFSLKNEPAQKGDFVEIEYKIEGKTLKDGFILGQGHFLPGFEDNLIGLKSGQEKKDISLDKGGQKIKIDLKITSVQKVEFSQINDEFAKSLGDFKDLNHLKENIKQGINLEKERAEAQKLRQEILNLISKETEIEIPDILIENEKKNMLENLKKMVSQRIKVSFQEYLDKIKKTEKEILDSFDLEAKTKIKNFLILQEIGEKEKVEVSDQEIMDEVNKILRRFPSVKEAEKNIGLDLQKFKDYTKQVIYNEKVFKILKP
jgi:trigger factor